ncbi:MAG TPA: cytochrome c-type biogenesis protein CcmH [Solirubrobacteraceae bacterium]
MSRARRLPPPAATAVLALALALLAPPSALAGTSSAVPAARAHAYARAGAHTRAAGSIAPRTNLPAVESQVMCVTCKISLSVAQSPQADRERVFIQHLIDEGRTLPQIKRALVFQYGPTVLALPPGHGFDLGVYLVPAAVVLALLVTVALLLPRWRRRARAAQAAREAEQAPSSTLSPADAERLQADMARFD